MSHIIAVIPARGGSKGVPKKNLHPLAGRPLIAHAIEAAKQSKYVERVIVSTDDQEIARIAADEGAEVIMRPAELATDEAPTEAALLHVVETLKAAEGYEVKVVVTLEPTSPLRTPELINRCLQILCEKDADSVFTVVEMRACLGRLDAAGRFSYVSPHQPRRRQDRELLYQENGAVYVSKAAMLASQRRVTGGEAYGMVINSAMGIDINTPADFALAEALMTAGKETKA